MGGKLSRELIQRLRNNSISELDLYAQNIGEEGAKELSELLLSNNSLTALYLQSNNIGAEGAKEISKSLLSNTSLKEFNLMWNNIGDEGAKEISKLLLSNNFLTHLNLNGNNIGAEGAKEISKSLLSNTSLSTLYLGGNNIGEKTFKEIEKELAGNYIIEGEVIKRVEKKKVKQNSQPPIKFSAGGVGDGVGGSGGGDDGSGSGSGGGSEGVGFGRVQRTEGVENILYVGVIKLMEGYLPPLSCCDHMIQDLPLSLNGLGDIELITKESKRFAENRLAHLPANEKRLSLDGAIAIAAYTFDLGFNSNTKDGSDNLFVILNNVLRERNGAKMIKLKPFLYYLMSGLSKLDAVKGLVYRGIPSSSLSVVQEKYIMGSEIHWSGFTSTTTSLRTAQNFAKGNGIMNGNIFRIKVTSGRSIVHYSSFPNEEEILLSPNWRAFISSECHIENDGFYYVDLVERVDSAIIF